MMGKELTEKQKKIDMNNDGVIDEKDFSLINADRTGGDTMKLKKADGGEVKGYMGGGMVKGYEEGGLAKGKKCPHRGTVRGTGAAIGGAKFTGVK
jgi:hypothetical protein